MSTVDITECRRRLERHATLSAFPERPDERGPARTELLLAYLPLLLDEVEDLRSQRAKGAAPAGDA